MMAQRVALLISGYCLHGGLHVLPMSVGVSSGFSGYLRPSRNMTLGLSQLLHNHNLAIIREDYNEAVMTVCC